MKITKVTRFVITLNEACERLMSYQKDMIAEMLPSACNPQELAERIYPLLGTPKERQDAFDKAQIGYIETPVSLAGWVRCFELYPYVFLNPSMAEILSQAILEKKSDEEVQVYLGGRQVNADNIQF